MPHIIDADELLEFVEAGMRHSRLCAEIEPISPNGEYDVVSDIVRRFSSVKEASRIMKIGSSNISNCAKNKVLIKDGKEYRCQSAGGYIWKYE